MANGESADSPILTDGTTSFSGGVDSIVPTTIASPLNPEGLARNKLAWLINGTTRDAGISPRWGWQPVCRVSDGTKQYQRGFLYDPGSNTLPYFIFQIGGSIIQVNPQGGTVTDLSAKFKLTNPPGVDRAFFCQAEKFLVIQPGDFATLPLFWDGSTLRRSRGITNTAVAAGTPGVNEIPAAGPMDYSMNRLWWAQDRTYSAGDFVGQTSGTLANRFKDSVLNVTENPLVLTGDGFSVPDNAGNIRALKHAANLDTALGQTNLFVFTRKAVYSMEVPVNRTDWINANANNTPLQRVVQLVNGAVNDDCVVPVNGDLYYQSFEPGIRSLVAAIRYFQQPGNIEISAEENRLLQFTDRGLMKYASGIEFDNRLLQTALPFQTHCGVAHRALVPLDFVPASSFHQQYTPIWEGSYEGLDFLQLFQGDFGGLQRAFGTVVMRKTGDIWLYELTDGDRFEQGDQRTTMQIEFPAFNFGREFDMKKLIGGELWIDRLYGTVEFYLDYRVDGEACWVPWHNWKDCVARDSNEMVPPLLTPYPKACGTGYRQTIDFPKPPEVCDQMMRPSSIGYQFQPRLTIHGYCRVRGIFVHGVRWTKKLYQNIPCK